MVTGAAKRVGRGIALDFASRGWAVGVHFRNSEAAAHEVVAQIRAEGGRAAALHADLASEDQVQRLVSTATAALGPLPVVQEIVGSSPAVRASFSGTAISRGNNEATCRHGGGVAACFRPRNIRQSREARRLHATRMQHGSSLPRQRAAAPAGRAAAAQRRACCSSGRAADIRSSRTPATGWSAGRASCTSGR
jgi:hypothetical protein